MFKDSNNFCRSSFTGKHKPLNTFLCLGLLLVLCTAISAMKSGSIVKACCTDTQLNLQNLNRSREHTASWIVKACIFAMWWLIRHGGALQRYC